MSHRRSQFARRYETLERRTVLSAVAPVDVGLHVDEADVDPYGHEYHAIPLPDFDLLDNNGVGDGVPRLGNHAGPPLVSPVQLDPLADTFRLHSNGDAAHKIYLDFTGDTTSGTYWNSSFNGGADIVTPQYDFTGDAGFSSAELQRIQYIWQRVAEDFAPFDVDVTTQDPGSEGLRNSGGGDDAWGIRVVIGGDGAWYGSAGGVAYLNSFDWSSDTPVFVFENNLGNGHEKYTAEAISHEVGHSLGLSHDGNSSTGYYQGHGSGETGWAPIMGVGYYRNLVQWSRGEYPGANNTQDDLAIITSGNGFGYRTDDHGDASGDATLLNVHDDQVSGSGIIERNTDVDVFSFTTTGGALDLTFSPAARGANLDILAELYDASNNLIASANPEDLLSAEMDVSLAAGQYFLHISGTGKGDPLAGGYSDYGSLGQYTISGTIEGAADAAIPPPVSSVSPWSSPSGSTVYTPVVADSIGVFGDAPPSRGIGRSLLNHADTHEFLYQRQAAREAFAAFEAEHVEFVAPASQTRVVEFDETPWDVLDEALASWDD